MSKKISDYTPTTVVALVGRVDTGFKTLVEIVLLWNSTIEGKAYITEVGDMLRADGRLSTWSRAVAEATSIKVDENGNPVTQTRINKSGKPVVRPVKDESKKLLLRPSLDPKTGKQTGPLKLVPASDVKQPPKDAGAENTGLADTLSALVKKFGAESLVQALAAQIGPDAILDMLPEPKEKAA
jgi:hypothetical protein